MDHAALEVDFPLDLADLFALGVVELLPRLTGLPGEELDPPAGRVDPAKDLGISRAAPAQPREARLDGAHGISGLLAEEPLTGGRLGEELAGQEPRLETLSEGSQRRLHGLERAALRVDLPTGFKLALAGLRSPVARVHEVLLHGHQPPHEVVDQKVQRVEPGADGLPLKPKVLGLVQGDLTAEGEPRRRRARRLPSALDRVQCVLR